MNNMPLARPAMLPDQRADFATAQHADGIRSIITEALSLFARRWRIIGGILIGSLILGLVVTLLLTPQYRASATLEIQRENAGLVNVRENDPRLSMVDQEFYETQYGLLLSRSLSERIVADLKLQDNAQFFDLFGFSNDWFEGGRLLPRASTREERLREATEILMDHMSLDHGRLSRLVEIRFISPDAQLSKRVVDSWAKNFASSTLERKFDATADARKFLDNRLAQLRARIDESERKLVDYASRESIINLPAQAGDPGDTSERPFVADDLARLNRALGLATADRVKAESRLRTPGGQSAEALSNEAIGNMRQQRAALAAEYAKMMTQFEPDYPPARSLQNQIRQMDRAIGGEETRIKGALQEAYESSRTREAALQTRVNQLKSGLLDLRRRSIQYNIYQRDADTNRQLYEALLQRYKEIGVAGGIGVNNISVVDAAKVPDEPASPKLLLNLAIAFVLGLALGVGLAWALEQIDQGVADPSEIEADLRLPLLGTIPKTADGATIDALEDRKSEVSEAYVTVQTSLAFSTDHGVPRTIAVTSTRPSEGKSTTAFALAVTLARTNRRVLLIDADMRSPSVHHTLGIENGPGLSNYLAGNSENLPELIHSSGPDGLMIMTAGQLPPSAPELLAGTRLEQLIEGLLTKFGNLVFGAPPVMGLADAPLLASSVEGVVYVIEAHSTQKSMATVALRRLGAANAHISGAVLTKFDPKRAHYGYGYGYGYGYDYGNSKQAG